MINFGLTFNCLSCSFSMVVSLTSCMFLLYLWGMPPTGRGSIYSYPNRKPIRKKFEQARIGQQSSLHPLEPVCLVGLGWFKKELFESHPNRWTDSIRIDKPLNWFKKPEPHRWTELNQFKPFNRIISNHLTKPIWTIKSNQFEPVELNNWTNPSNGSFFEFWIFPFFYKYRPKHSLIPHISSSLILYKKFTLYFFLQLVN